MIYRSDVVESWLRLSTPVAFTCKANSFAFSKVRLKIVSILNPFVLSATANRVATFPEPINDIDLIFFKMPI